MPMLQIQRPWVQIHLDATHQRLARWCKHLLSKPTSIDKVIRIFVINETQQTSSISSHSLGKIRQRLPTGIWLFRIIDPFSLICIAKRYALRTSVGEIVFSNTRWETSITPHEWSNHILRSRPKCRGKTLPRVRVERYETRTRTESKAAGCPGISCDWYWPLFCDAW